MAGGPRKTHLAFCGILLRLPLPTDQAWLRINIEKEDWPRPEPLLDEASGGTCDSPGSCSRLGR